MAVTYIEEYRVPTPAGNVTYGIEDYEAPGDHFFPDYYFTGQCKRFRLWRSGGGFGQADTLQEARDKLAEYAMYNLRNDISAYKSALVRLEAAHEQADDSADPMSVFLVRTLS